jgi:hypothetical protein
MICLQTDGRTWWNQYTPLQLRCGGYNKWVINISNESLCPWWYCSWIYQYQSPLIFLFIQGPSWSLSFGSWIYNYLCNQCLSLLMLWVRIPLKRGVLNTTLCDKVCPWLLASHWFSRVTLVSSTNKTDCHDITEYCWKWC